MSDLPHLLCLHHAGGAATAFATWPAGLDGIVRVTALDAPGRGRRRAEPLATDMPALLDALREPALEATADGAPVALLGHSLGSLVARELAPQLVAAGRDVVLLVAAGRNGPTRHNATDPIAGLPDDAFLDGVLALGGVPAAVEAEPSLLGIFIEAMRTDLAIAEGHLRPPDLPPLDCPVLVLEGTEDPVVSAAGAGAWASETTGATEVTWWPGGHFFLHEPGFVRSALRPLLRRRLAP